MLSPTIDSITATKSVLNEGETSIVVVHASDPHNENLEYQRIGTRLRQSDAENTFTITADQKSIGTHVFRFLVVNESNAISEIAEFEITIED